MKVELAIPQGSFEARIENIQEYSLTETDSICVADYECGDGSLTFLRFGTDFELVGIHRNRRRARIHAKQVSASYHGLEGGRIHA